MTSPITLRVLAQLILFCSIAFSVNTTASPAISSLPLQSRGAVNTTSLHACAALSLSSSASSLVVTPFTFFDLADQHYMITSSQVSTCTVQPATAQDLAATLKTIAAKRAKFAVVAGGHTGNQGFSSTDGVLISLEKFNEISLDKNTQQVTYGAGVTWDTVYNTLEGTGYNVVGGRVAGVGVGGYHTGGGGYSWLSNQFGLAADNLISVDMVLPNGTLATASESNNADLFWAIRGGGNRFGIVYSFTVKAHPQPAQVYGGYRIAIGDANVQKVISATAKFAANNTASAAQIITTLNSELGIPRAIVLAYYPGTSAPAGSLDAFDGISWLIDGWKVQTFSSLVSSIPSNLQKGQRGGFESFAVKTLSVPMLQYIAKTVATLGKSHSATLTSIEVEPFASTLPGMAKSAAWDHSSNAWPQAIYFAWTSSADDVYWRKQLVDLGKTLTAMAQAEGQDLSDAYLYPNYAGAGTALSAMYPPENLARLKTLRAEIDPQNVMGLTTWFDF
ncbi:FAD-binding domain-containing protein [Microstroma glucosiphilum]|uniref:FAD-binding domain-containing protein n=1 Tax=Pseudomicrostroma glucosiphilum TaxID=1684307 RepID=A0A316U0M1_9BASI|nr:FAD-binding domain-containing protein [Pseudomicrostroma glucosiphilum]PWN18434.1 FAD-binding domain-containing protein [Pseudomicrostroma glucosiphilum]